MTEVLEPVIEAPEAGKKKRGFFRKFRKAPLSSTGEISRSPKKTFWTTKRKTYLFVFLMLLYPVAHFLLMWIAVNFNSILLTFKTYESWQLKWVFDSNLANSEDSSFFSTLFYNYINLIESLKTQSDIQYMFCSSVVYFGLACFVTLPIAMVFSYFVFKKIRGAGFFKIIFFLPSILPLFILCQAYYLSFNPSGGLLPGIADLLGIETGTFFNSLFVQSNVFGTSSSWMVWIFFVWSGIGYDVILLTAAMSRIPRDILESVKMDGVGSVKEFFRIIIPLTWPTITTLFVFGMMAMFNTTFQPQFLTPGDKGTQTIGLYIYLQSQTGTGALNVPATLGLFCSIIVAPIIVGVRALMNRAYKDVGF